MKESSVFLLLPGLILGRIQEVVLALRSQENVVLDVHTPGLQGQAAARPLSCPSDPPTEETGTGWAGVRQAANLASARTWLPDRSLPTFHSLVTRHGHETQHPTPRGPDRGWRNVKERPPPEQQAKPRGKKSREDVPHCATVPKKMPTEQNANQTKSIKTRDWLPPPQGGSTAEWSRGLESALGLSGVCPNSAGGSERTGWGPRLPLVHACKLCPRSSPGQGFPAYTGDSPQGPRRCPHITHTCLSSPSLHPGNLEGLRNPPPMGNLGLRCRGSCFRLSPREGR